jgi:hypothetical protein
LLACPGRKWLAHPSGFLFRRPTNSSTSSRPLRQLDCSLIAPQRRWTFFADGRVPMEDLPVRGE